MSKSIRVTMTRPSTTTVWPFDIEPWKPTLENQFLEFENLGIQSWIIGNEDNDLTLVVDHYFTDNANFEVQKNLAYTKIPLWTNNSNRPGSDEYCQANNITIEITEVDNPDLSAYTQITETRERTYTALNSIF
jgi:hypothetical protein